MKRLLSLLFFALALCVYAPPTRAQAADDYYKRAMARFKQGDADGAIADLDKAIQLFPRYDAAYGSRGQIRKSKGDLEGAVADFSKAVELNPKNVIALYTRGFTREEAPTLKLECRRFTAKRASARFGGQDARAPGWRSSSEGPRRKSRCSRTRSE